MGRCIPTFLYIAPDTSDIASSEPDKIGRFTLMEALSLDGIESLYQR
jgi:hypothetical protein